MNYFKKFFLVPDMRHRKKCIFQIPLKTAYISIKMTKEHLKQPNICSITNRYLKFCPKLKHMSSQIDKIYLKSIIKKYCMSILRLGLAKDVY